MKCGAGEVLLDVGADAPICMSVADATATIAAARQIPEAYQPRVVNQTLATLQDDFGVSGTTLAVVGGVIGLVLLMSLLKK